MMDAPLTSACNDGAWHAVVSLSNVPQTGSPDARFRCICWTLENLDPVSGRPLYDSNPYLAVLTESEAAFCDNAVSTWLLLRDAELWAVLGNVLRTTPRPLQAALIGRCRRIRASSAADKQAIRIYRRVWPASIHELLARTLGSMATVAEMCEFLSTYKPRGAAASLPFAVAASVVLEVIEEQPQSADDPESLLLGS